MITKVSVIAVCLTVGLATVTTSTQAGLFDIFKANKSAKKAALVAAPVAAPEPAPLAAPHNLPDARYPNGLGWRAIELDFIDVKEHIKIVEGKVDKVKADTESIILELEDVDADHITIMKDLTAIKTDLGNVADDVSDMAGDVAMLKNAVQVQVSVAPASAESRNEVNDAPVTLYVQVIQNGEGLSGLGADAFTFLNSFPSDDPGSCCTVTGFSEGEGFAGLYALELTGDWVAGTYAGTLTALDSDTSASGTSLVTFDIPAEPIQ